MLDRLAALEQRYNEIEAQMGQPEIAGDYPRLQALIRERSALDERVSLARRLRKASNDLTEAEALARDASDQEMSAMAKEEAAQLRLKVSDLEERVRHALLPRDPNDDRNVIVEIRAGVGGEEASLFGAEMYRMYTRYAQRQGWQTELLDASPSERGGYKEVVFEVKGDGAFSKLKFERGVHRVQRIPTTESSGRVHTSTVSVAVLPEAEELDVNIRPEDIRIDIFHAGGHGGQNVNKVATAVRIVHIPTGTTAVCQDERSQLKNKQKAMAMLRTRIYEQEQRKHDAAIAADRKQQVGNMERSEKVRTYNFPQDRMSDHRIGLNLHGLGQLMEGYMEDLVEALQNHEQARLLAEALGQAAPDAAAADDADQ